MKKVMIVTGEASGDLHGANLVRALRQRLPDLRIYGMGGSELEREGMDLLYDAAKVAVVGISEVFSHLQDIFAAQKILRRCLAEDPPDLVILIDLPDFNLMIAKQAKKRGIPVFYYITPQVWAWRRGRARKLKRYTDKLGVILPFEEAFFRELGVDAEYVGHPLLDSVRCTLTKEEFRAQQQLPANVKCIGLLPGSRKREIDSLLPIFLKAATKLQADTSDHLVFLLPKASTLSHCQLDAAGLANYHDKLDIRVISENRYNMMAACDGVVAASGTVTLELAILQVPMVVVYKISMLTYRLAKLLVHLRFFSLVNLIAGNEVVPELLQHEVTPPAICDHLKPLLTNTPKRQKMVAALQKVNDALGESGASARAANAAYRMLFP
jgi:lipid-A-disaccharide synthase